MAMPGESIMAGQGDLQIWAGIQRGWSKDH